MRIAAVLACAIGVVAGAWVARWFGATPSVGAPGLGELEKRLDRLDESVRSLSEELERSRPAGGGSPADVSRPESSGTEVSRTELAAPLRDELDTLSATVQSLLAELRMAREDPAKVNPPVPKDEQLVGDLIDRHDADSERADAELFCWTPWQVFHRYGQPDSVMTSGAQEISWGYFDPRSQRKLYVVFTGGYAEDVRVTERAR